ncbi:MAG: HD domain-containing protein [Patescibacteria group bacterium]|nr:HD domain-containing protein [Patescibacteria group bacterium]MDD5121074.1 HD domain-containing protein [Patescibacteria group bacterium]MDD5221564.1 HD domain-containing protein [Patescibacteria group bacterium]MDD5396007.1 HD domain-containing protein [Patescibacteria group bacterium]
MFTLNEVKKNPQIIEFINQTVASLKALAYTEHGPRHLGLVSDRARNLAKCIGLNKIEQELVAIAAYCHDIGNFLGRTEHHYWGALLFHQIFQQNFSARDLSQIIQAITNHDKEEMKFSSKISAVLVIADKSDVHRSRVIDNSPDNIAKDIHDRVNYATTDSKLRIDKKNKKIILTLKIDTKFVPIMEYFEIFTGRMTYCRTAADYLGYKFNLVINNIKLL